MISPHASAAAESNARIRISLTRKERNENSFRSVIRNIDHVSPGLCGPGYGLAVKRAHFQHDIKLIGMRPARIEIGAMGEAHPLVIDAKHSRPPRRHPSTRPLKRLPFQGSR